MEMPVSLGETVGGQSGESDPSSARNLIYGKSNDARAVVGATGAARRDAGVTSVLARRLLGPATGQPRLPATRSIDRGACRNLIAWLLRRFDAVRRQNEMSPSHAAANSSDDDTAWVGHVQADASVTLFRQYRFVSLLLNAEPI